jgi:hypothetical protein
MRPPPGDERAMDLRDDNPLLYPHKSAATGTETPPLYLPVDQADAKKPRAFQKAVNREGMFSDA